MSDPVTVAGFTIAELAQLLTAVGVVFMIARGIITKKDCDKCKTETEIDLDSGREEFKDVRETLAGHGTQIAGIGSTVTAMAKNVQTLVSHHIGGGNN